LHPISLTGELHIATQVIDMTMEFDKKLDNIFLNELYDGDAVYAATVFDTFLQEVRSMMEGCLNAIENGDIPVFQKAVHKFKPTLSYVGLTDIGKQLESLEKACGLGTSANELLATYKQIAGEIDNLLPLIKIEKDKLDALTINTD
jgi:HPt (histidine-containing phosphotransfer) domain-containing protein